MKIEASAFEVAELVSFLQGRIQPGDGKHVADSLDQEIQEFLSTGVVAEAPTDLSQQVKNIVYDEMHHVLADIEFRVKQAYDVENRHQVSGQVYAEDLHLQKHQLTGYTVTANTPTAGSIAWASLHVVYNGTDYAITDGNTASKYVWFDPAATNGTTTLQTSNTKPDLTAKPDAALLFVNNGGTPVDVVKSTMPVAVADGAIDTGAIIAGAVDSGALASGAVTSGKIGTGAVTSTAIASGAVGSTAIASGAVGTTQLAASAVDSSKIASGAVGTTQLASGAVTSTNIASGAVGSAQLTTGSVTAAKLNTLQHLLY